MSVCVWPNHHDGHVVYSVLMQGVDKYVWVDAVDGRVWVRDDMDGVLPDMTPIIASMLPQGTTLPKIF